ncbi:hypothetical protein XENOCAPTIV_005668, partial [Xenoophorus captivus]
CSQFLTATCIFVSACLSTPVPAIPASAPYTSMGMTGNDMTPSRKRPCCPHQEAPRPSQNLPGPPGVSSYL